VNPVEHALESESIRTSMDYSSLDASAQNIDYVEIERCRFTHAKLVGTKLSRATASDVVFDQCDLANLSAMTSSLLNASVTSSRLTGTSWVDCLLREILFESCRADLAVFKFSRFKHVVFQNCNLQQTNFQNADLRGAHFERCDLTGAQFSNAQMSGTYFSDCVLFDIRGVTSLAGATVRSDDILGLARSLANALGIKVED
jgi:uncharacterized protein YjbI with pentapeptide repeats